MIDCGLANFYFLKKKTRNFFSSFCELCLKLGFPIEGKKKKRKKKNIFLFQSLTKTREITSEEIGEKNTTQFEKIQNRYKEKNYAQQKI